MNVVLSIENTLIDASLTMIKITTRDFLETLQMAEKTVTRERAQRLSAIGLTAAQSHILSTLQRLGPMSLNELNAALPTDTPPSRVVSTLVDRKLVTRRDQVDDRRHVELGLTTRGKKKLVEIRRVEQAIQRWAGKKLKKLPLRSTQKALIALADG